jgi:hypothetical protein
VTAEEIETRTDPKADNKNKEHLVPHSSLNDNDDTPITSSSSPLTPVPQPPYLFGSTQIEMFLDTSQEYFIIPSLKNRKQSGTYFLTIYSEDVDVTLTTNATTVTENKSKNCQVGNQQILLTNIQFYEKVEEVRERIQNEAKNLNLTVHDLIRIFPDHGGGGGKAMSSSSSSSSSDISISRTAFKRKLIELGFSLADFPDEDFIVLDEDNNGVISRKEFIDFFQIQYDIDDPNDQKIEPPADDLLFQPSDIAGQLSINVNLAKGLRKASTWFTPPSATLSSSVTTTVGSGLGPKPRDKFIYSIDDAIKSRKEPIKIWQYPSRSRAASLNKSAVMSTIQTPRKLPTSTSVTTTSAIATDLLTPLKIETSLEETNIINSPKTFFSIRKNQISTNALALSATNLKTIDESTIPKIHTDPLLLSTEVNRSGALARWREKSIQNQSIETSNANQLKELSTNSMLINRHCFKKKSTELWTAYPIYQFLGVTPEGYRQLFPGSGQDPAIDPATRVVPQVEELQEQRQLQEEELLTLKRVSSSTKKYRSLDYDIWDILIDRVSIISSCRNRDVLYLTHLLNRSMNKQYFPVKTFDNFSTTILSGNSGIITTIPTPSKTPQTHIATKKGTPSMSTTTKNLTGTASVKLKHPTTSSSKLTNTITMARDLLDHMSSEIQYLEIYRRLIPIPLVEFPQLDETLEVCGKIISQSIANFNLTLRGWFEYFDVNHDGEISFDEFVSAVNGRFNANLSHESLMTLFMRFQINSYDELIDWNEFLFFYERYINQKYIERIVIDDENENENVAEGGGSGVGNDVDMIHLLHQFITLYDEEQLLVQMPPSTNPAQQPPLPTQQQQQTSQKISNPVTKKTSLYKELVTLNKNDLNRNTQLVTQAGLRVTTVIMDRFSRLFDYNISNLKQFCFQMNQQILKDLPTFEKRQQNRKKTSDTSTSTPPPTARQARVKELISMYLSQEMSQTLISLLAALSSRCQTSTSSLEGKQKINTQVINFDIFNFTSEEEFQKLWLALASSCDSSIPDEKFLNYLETILSQYIESISRSPLPPPAPVSSAPPSAVPPAVPPAAPSAVPPAKPSTPSPIDPLSKTGLSHSLSQPLQRRVFCHLIRDEILHSCWNKINLSKGGVVDQKTRTISYSAFKAFIRRSHIDVIEQKLQYLVLLQNSSGRGSINYLVHFFLPTIQDGPFRDESQLNHLIMLAYDPISSTIFTMKVTLLSSHPLLCSAILCSPCLTHSL